MWYSDKFWTDVCNVETRARYNAKLAASGIGCKAKDSLHKEFNLANLGLTRDQDADSSDILDLGRSDQSDSHNINSRYVIPAKARSNIHNLAGTLQNGYDTPNSWREEQELVRVAREKNLKLNKTRKIKEQVNDESAASEAGGAGSGAVVTNNTVTNTGNTNAVSSSGPRAQSAGPSRPSSEYGNSMYISSGTGLRTPSENSFFEVTDASYFFAPSCGYFRLGQLNPMNNNSSQFACCMKNSKAAGYYEGYDWRFGRRVKNIRHDQEAPKRMAKARSDHDLMKSVKECQVEARNAHTFRQ